MERRYFLRNFILFTGGLVSANVYGRLLPGFLPATNDGKKINGKITTNGKPLANVIVTDCFSVVATDSKGVYSIEPHPDAQFITISTPAGYAFINEEHIVRQYKPISSISGNNKADFELTPLPSDDNKHQFIIWADPQVKNNSDVAMLMKESVPDMQKMLGTLAKGTLIHGICVGDIVWDNHDLFPEYETAVKLCGIPFFQAKGNHDMDYGLGGNETSAITFKKKYGPTHYSFNRGKAHYVVLDDVFYLGTERDYKGHITQDQLDWLQKDLSFVQKDTLLIVCTHIPVHNSVDNKDDLYALLKPFSNCHIMSGHTHYNRNVITDNIFEHNHGTVCGAWWTGPICEDGTPDGYGVYEVDGTALKWYYKSTGKEKDHQLSLFIQKNDSGKEEMIANVFNWDPAWKVECWIDNIYKGELKSKPGLDPLAVLTLAGPELPVTRKFAEPKKTDHLFSQELTAGYKKIKVLATDRFGNQFKAVV